VAASDAGADAIGMVFYAKSPRFVADLGLARDIAQAAGPFVTVVGLFVDASAADIEKVLARVPLGLLQFHGDESESFCAGFAHPYIKAMRMKPEINLTVAVAAYPSACGVLLDAYRPGVPGGTGEVFDWRRIPADLKLPLILAGGLNAENVAAAVQQVQPWAVDVSGGVEQAPGIKDTHMVDDFIRQAKSVQISINS
jgi:phosphoribosylanthranilate isomerase